MNATGYTVWGYIHDSHCQDFTSDHRVFYTRTVDGLCHACRIPDERIIRGNDLVQRAPNWYCGDMPAPQHLVTDSRVDGFKPVEDRFDFPVCKRSDLPYKHVGEWPPRSICRCRKRMVLEPRYPPGTVEPEMDDEYRVTGATTSPVHVLARDQLVVSPVGMKHLGIMQFLLDTKAVRKALAHGREHARCVDDHVRVDRLFHQLSGCRRSIASCRKPRRQGHQPRRPLGRHLQSTRLPTCTRPREEPAPARPMSKDRARPRNQDTSIRSLRASSSRRASKGVLVRSARRSCTR